jgi:hypothetical protein
MIAGACVVASLVAMAGAAEARPNNIIGPLGPSCDPATYGTKYDLVGGMCFKSTCVDRSVVSVQTDMSNCTPTIDTLTR